MNKLTSMEWSLSIMNSKLDSLSTKGKKSGYKKLIFRFIKKVKGVN